MVDWFWLFQGSNSASSLQRTMFGDESGDDMAIVRLGQTHTRSIQFVNSTGVASYLNAGFTVSVYKNGVVDLTNVCTLTVIAGIAGGYLLSYPVSATFLEGDRLQFYVVGVLTTGGDTVTSLSPILQVATIPTTTENADGLLNRDMSAVTVTNSRSPINALRILRNRVVRSTAAGAGTLDVYNEGDAVIAWSSVTVVSANVGPITSSDPA